MKKRNIIGYGIAFGSLLCLLFTAIMMLYLYGAQVPPTAEGAIIAKSMLLNLIVLVIGVITSKYKSE